MEQLWEISGWVGAVAILSAYLAVSMGWLQAGRGFQAANLAGSCAFMINGAFHEAWPSVVTNAAWFLISAAALVRMTALRGPVAPETAAAQLPGIPGTAGQPATEPTRPSCSA
jgi:hypothetical protein